MERWRLEPYQVKSLPSLFETANHLSTYYRCSLAVHSGSLHQCQ